MGPRIAFTQSINSDSQDKRLFNTVVALYDNCKADNEYLAAQVNTCIEYQKQCEATKSIADSIIRTQSILLQKSDSVSKLQRLEISNYGKEVRDEKKISVRRIAGFTVGGFCIGVAVPVLIYLFKK